MVTLRKNQPDYPTKLMNLASPPPKLYVKSNDWLNLIDLPMIGVVGSRKLTPYGRQVTEEIIASFSGCEVVIVSGLALGIDSVAHNAALKHGLPTIAALPSGTNNIYPSSHRGLAERIVKSGGALVSEYEPDAKVAFKSNFIARNRIVAALSDVVLIPEAAKNSGSLHTANFALEMGRDIFAVPGPINSPTSEGCNNLIKMGAYLASSGNDILNKLGLTNQAGQRALPLVEDKNQALVIQVLSDGPTDIEKIQSSTGLDAASLNQALSMLEIYGHIKALGGGVWSIN